MLLSLGMCSKKNLIYNKKIIITRHTLVWEGILVAVFFSSVWLQYLGDGGTDHREIVHYGTYRSRPDLIPFWGWYRSKDPQIRNFGPNFWPFDRIYLENSKSQRYVSIRA